MGSGEERGDGSDGAERGDVQDRVEEGEAASTLRRCEGRRGEREGADENDEEWEGSRDGRERCNCAALYVSSSSSLLSLRWMGARNLILYCKEERRRRQLKQECPGVGRGAG